MNEYITERTKERKQEPKETVLFECTVKMVYTQPFHFGNVYIVFLNKLFVQAVGC